MPTAWDTWNEKLRQLDAKLSAQLIQRTVALRRRVDELENEIGELRQAGTHDWNRSDSGILYKIFTEKRNFDDAEAICKSFHSQLAVIESQHKNDYIKDLLEETIPESKNEDKSLEEGEAWIGLKTGKIEMSSDEGSFSNFAEDQPVNGCATMNQSGKWAIRNCTEQRAFVCELQPEKNRVPAHSDSGNLKFLVKCCEHLSLFDDVYRK
ncbi:unnamed protein product [Gongylonema pulchrum]|uniref:C-type lectin domain-containing protein n=1 Tax=Gongylonema pulchrum TaxID=637853 RepID=A0A183DYE0_9BILA|nr:unnamed protein product [Gongylonema pulchrum]